MIERGINWLLGKGNIQPEVPSCPDHEVLMNLRGKMGKPAIYEAQPQETYTYIYFCPVTGCNQTAEIRKYRSQTPKIDETPVRPVYARRDR